MVCLCDVYKAEEEEKNDSIIYVEETKGLNVFLYGQNGCFNYCLKKLSAVYFWIESYKLIKVVYFVCMQFKSLSSTDLTFLRVFQTWRNIN